MQNEQRIACPSCGSLCFPHDDVCLTCGRKMIIARPMNAVPLHPPLHASDEELQQEERGPIAALLVLLVVIGSAVIYFLSASGLWRIFAHTTVWLGISTVVFLGVTWTLIQRESERRQFMQLHRRRHDPATDAAEVAALQVQIETQNAHNQRRRRFLGRYWW